MPSSNIVLKFLRLFFVESYKGEITLSVKR